MINERIKGVKPEIMRVNEREIVIIGIINYFNNNREVERQEENEGVGTAPHNYTYPQNSTHNP